MAVLARRYKEDDGPSRRQKYEVEELPAVHGEAEEGEHLLHAAAKGYSMQFPTLREELKAVRSHIAPAFCMEKPTLIGTTPVLVVSPLSLKSSWSLYLSFVPYLQRLEYLRDTSCAIKCSSMPGV